MTTLKGIAWNHTRGFVSVVASAQRFEELHPDVRIIWEKRSLQAFADASLAELAAKFDLIIMDHPHTALAATAGLLLPFDDWLSSDFLADQAANSVGASYKSYSFNGKQWTLATDAATPVASWRPDLIERHHIPLPRTWEEVLELARSGFVSVAAFPIDLLMHTYMFCAALGHEPFSEVGKLAPEDVLTEALGELGKLLALCDPACFERNPIRLAEWMSQASEARACYCPFAYGYSNYSRPGYAKYVLQAGGLVEFRGVPLRSTLGGAGIAVSSKTNSPHACMAFAEFIASPDIQKGIYFQAGGQPGYRGAWTHQVINSASNNFFLNTLETLDHALLRPQNAGYMDFQNAATPLAAEAISGKLPPHKAAIEINALAQSTLTSLQ